MLRFAKQIIFFICQKYSRLSSGTSSAICISWSLIDHESLVMAAIKIFYSFFRQPRRDVERRSRQRRTLQRSPTSVVVVAVADVLRVGLLRVGVGPKTFRHLPTRRHLPALLQDLRPIDPLLGAQLLVPGDPRPRCHGANRSGRLPVRYEVRA